LVIPANVGCQNNAKRKIKPGHGRTSPRENWPALRKFDVDLTTMKALPSSYNRDIQGDKKALFDSVDTTKSALEVFAAMLPELRVNRERMENAARDPNLLATDLAEYLVKKGTPFSRGAPNRWRACCALHNEKRSTGSNRHGGNEKVFTTLRR
jgi:hypothetical protein